MVFCVIGEQGNIEEIFKGWKPNNSVIEAPEEVAVEPNNWSYKDGQFIYTPYQQPLDEMKIEKITKLNNLCEADIIRGFTSATTGYFYAFGTYDQLNFTQQYSLLIGDPAITSVDWKTEDEGIITHTRDEFITVASVEAVQHKRSLISRYWTLKAQIEVATTKEEVDAIVW